VQIFLVLMSPGNPIGLAGTKAGGVAPAAFDPDGLSN
jgi:hypothetical protein